MGFLLKSQINKATSQSFKGTGTAGLEVTAYCQIHDNSAECAFVYTHEA
jgi:hypothetical protein